MSAAADGSVIVAASSDSTTLGEIVVTRSETFRDLWATHDVEGKSMTRKTLMHPQVGRIDLVMQTSEMRSAPGQELRVYDAEPGSESAAHLALLGSIAATARVEARVHPIENSMIAHL